MPKLVVGIDPGVRVGIAGVDVRTGRIWYLSRLSPSRGRIEAEIAARGEPLLVATDKARPPRTVRAVAAAFSGRVCAPSHDLGVAEKNEITRGLKFKNRHERDALAAALVCYRRMGRMFLKIKKKLAAKGKSACFEEVAALVVKRRMSIFRALKSLEKQ